MMIFHVGVVFFFIYDGYTVHTLPWFDHQNWINVRDPLYFLRYGIPYSNVNRILFSSWGNVG